MDATSTETASVTLLRRRSPRLVIVEQHAAFADALEASLWDRFRVRQVIVSSESTVAGVVAAVRSGPPHLVLVTTELGPFVPGEAVIDGLTAHGIRVVALSPSGIRQDPVRWGRCLGAGALGVLSPDCGLATLQDALGRALVGQSPHSSAERTDLMAAARRADRDDLWTARARLERLSPRERQIVIHLMAGRCAAAIARENFVSEATVRTQLKSVLAKLGVNSQLAAVALAHLAGWQVPAERHLAS
jgi:two-component system, NarL family, nitrate/nitrite response regulator NarL